jgi:hypothetical protein
VRGEGTRHEVRDGLARRRHCERQTEEEMEDCYLGS